MIDGVVVCGQAVNVMVLFIAAAAFLPVFAAVVFGGK